MCLVGGDEGGDEGGAGHRAAYTFRRAARAAGRGRGEMIPAVMPTYARADVAFERGEGAYLYATDGRRYVLRSTAAFSPDGRWLAYSSDEWTEVDGEWIYFQTDATGERALWRVRADGGDVESVIQGGTRRVRFPIIQVR